MKAAPSDRLVNVTSENVERLTFWERTYIPEILKALAFMTKRALTNWVNMILWFVGVKKKKAIATSYYPEELRSDYSPRTRGKHVLVQNPDGSMRCVACLMCATICPAECILIQACESDVAEDQRYPETFSLDMSRCIMCGLCVEACPKDAIRMTTDVHLWAPDGSMTDRRKMVYDRDELLTWNPTIKYD